MWGLAVITPAQWLSCGQLASYSRAFCLDWAAPAAPLQVIEVAGSRPTGSDRHDCARKGGA